MAVRTRTRTLVLVLGVAFALTLAAGSGCGYRLRSGAASRGLSPSGVHVPMLLEVVAPPLGRSPSEPGAQWSGGASEPGAQALFTLALRQELARRGMLGDERAAARLTGRLVVGTPGALPQNQAYRLHATLEMELAREGKPPLTLAARREEAYLPGADVLGLESNRRSALNRLSASLAAEAVHQLLQTLSLAEDLERLRAAP